MPHQKQSSSSYALDKYKYRIIVAGTRGYSNCVEFSKVIFKHIENYDRDSIIFISGKAPTGADHLIIDWCKEHDYPWVEYPADWSIGNSAGYVRNVKMAEVGSELIAFWDHHSSGTGHMITICEKKSLPVFKYDISAHGIHFFYGSDNPLSQHFRASFIVHSIQFNCAEQFLMYCKAILFRDVDKARDILAESDPSIQKGLGRKVSNFNNELWFAKRENYARVGNYCKFKQNPELHTLLLNTHPNELVEASRYDRIWGIGIGITDDDRFKRTKWVGTNLLGKVLMQVRERLILEMK